MIIKKLILLFLFLSTSVSWSQLLFEESASAKGVGYAYGSAVYGGGVSFADFNNDGWDDLTYATDETKEVLFFQNNNGTFNLVDLGINDMYRVKQVIWVDYDNDGDKDFLATSITGFNKFYRNDGNLSFTDITSTCGLFTNNQLTYGATFGDLDNDGDLDVFIANRDDASFTQHNYLYRNDNGTFVDITSSAGINLASELSFCASFFDYDNDGDQDLYIANDKMTFINRLYQNNGDATFTDVSVSSGAGIAIDAMSTSIGDYNADGWFDVYVTHTAGNNLLKNNGDGTFTNVAVSTGTSFDSIAWGAAFLDADNDTELDLYVSGMLDGSDPNKLPSAFYHNQGGTFVIPTNIGFLNDTRSSFGNAIGDFNNDGLADIVVMNNSNENNFLWENKTTTANNWIKVKLEGTTSNKDGIGNKIEVFAGGKSQYRYTVCGEGYLGQNSDSEFIGLKDATLIDYIKVTWNRTGVVETIHNITPNQTIIIQEGNGVLNTQQEEKISHTVFPNPSDDGRFTINNLQQNFTYTVFNLQGKKLAYGELSPSQKTIDLHTLSSGVYLLKVVSDTTSEVFKILRE
ncbi:MAG: VCBS repeat-containing protein [Flavobacteriaceae bacterium]